MGSDKYTRNVKILCPTCGCSDFSYSEGPEETIQVMICASCEREFTRDDLLQENSENIQENLSEIKDEILKDVAVEIKKSLKKAFSRNKNIRLK